ncbi:uncharacterized protein LOC106872003 isoform X2 [Octopus bimaculoides]|uniref:uncharacterized protein LOC106872003 isoform X2 n=1 Tax=Octopus bimaculoides TaxID=37653 RepID=UPI00071DC3C8|nr:uncharacterized protein LOC106872003 isoform X2 [Octopus bimaculoides]|eukprot:XP_014774292.1 PREDICTED: uncharacterized protein LOC106872003 isoform X2 [Octopus bimaculoides]
MWLGQNKFVSSGPFSAILLGMVLGLLLEKSKVFDPEIVQKQMLFENFVMLKLFFSTLATGMFLCSIASMLQGHGGAVENTLIYHSANLIDQSYLSGILGGLFMGAGVACAGACPVSMFVQLGSGVPYALYVFLGAYCGTVLYDVIPPLAAKSKTSRQTYLHYSMSTPYFNVAMPLAVILATVTFFLELHKPWQNEYLVRFGGGSWLFAPVWSPYLIGISTAILQLILIGSFNKVITNSEVFTVINKTLMSIFKKGKLPSKSSKISTEYFWPSYEKPSLFRWCSSILGINDGCRMLHWSWYIWYNASLQIIICHCSSSVGWWFYCHITSTIFLTSTIIG